MKTNVKVNSVNNQKKQIRCPDCCQLPANGPFLEDVCFRKIIFRPIINNLIILGRNRKEINFYATRKPGTD